eukprot:Nitzschia sp. Nitz4//scaffold36_size144017//68897//69991//NITZ4_003093-RA/size144017-processed-gene-0.46-mRNA-1//1//CDS//3329549477//3905//frame0
MKSNYRKNAGRFGEVDDADVEECQPPPLPRSRWSTAFPNARGVLEEDNSICQPVHCEQHPVSTLCATYLFSDDMSSLGGSEHNRTFSSLPEVLTPPTDPADVVDISTNFQEVELSPCLLPTSHRFAPVSPVKDDSRPRSSKKKEESRASSSSGEKEKKKKSKKKHRSKKEEGSSSTMESSSRSGDKIRRKREHRENPSKERRSRREGSSSKEHRSRRASASCTSRSKDRSSSSAQVKPLRRIRSKSHRPPSRKSHQTPVDPQEILEVVTRSERATRSIDMVPGRIVNTPRQSPVDRKFMTVDSDVSPCSPTSAETEFSEFGDCSGKIASIKSSSRTPHRRSNPVVSPSRMSDLFPKVWGKRNLT